MNYCNNLYICNPHDEEGVTHRETSTIQDKENNKRQTNIHWVKRMINKTQVKGG